VTKHRIPLLCDRHSHPLLYSALMGSVDLNRPGETRESAIGRIRARAIDDSSGGLKPPAT
jgi:hypothetical protein